ncbi:MAG: hypothetical protein M3434_13935 [Gemmatimonadota bacterium]|jgi:voltage-gated potassium channel|nr:hypothetical protein [Gemmatimonadota bacterium]
MATMATFFLRRDAEDPIAEVAGAAAVDTLRAQITALREEIRALASQGRGTYSQR